LARWTSDHLHLFQHGADQAVTRMFIWHLAEEVEHKSVGHDLWVAVDGNRRRYVGNALLAACVVLSAVVAGTLVQLWSVRRLWNPLSWARLVWWATSVGMEVLPNLAASCLWGHHPSRLVDPTWYALWLADLDADGR